jgi:hypothetical protein
VIENIEKENEAKLKLKKKVKNSKNFENFEKIEIEKNTPCLCDIKSPICINDIENDFQHKVISFICLKTQSTPPKIIENYFIASPFGLKENLDESEINFFEGLLIERRPHTCTKLDLIEIQTDESDGLYNSMSRSNLSADVNSKRFSIDNDNGTSSVDDKLTSEEMTVNFNWNYMKVLENIKHDENFEKANKMMVMTFTPKPFVDIDEI